MTTLENHVCRFNSEHNDDKHEFVNIDNNGVEHLMDYPVETSSPLYTNLDALRHDYHNGIPSAVAYMQDFQEYTEDCLYENSEWRADERQKYGTTTIYRTQNVITPPLHDPGMPLMSPEMASPVPLNLCAP